MNKTIRLILTALIFSGTLTACFPQNKTTSTSVPPVSEIPQATAAVSSNPPGSQTPGAVEAVVPTPTLLPTPTSPPRVLTVCLGREPASLFLYHAVSTSARSVLETVYDGPFDVRDFNYHPVILVRTPSLANGDVRVEPVQVKAGESIVNNSGGLTVLGEQAVYRPSGCQAEECAQVFQGTGGAPVTMDQLVIRYQLRTDILWSDGVPLIADDSLFSYEVALSLPAVEQPEYVRLTAAYTVSETYTVEWRGVPGYLGAQPGAYFFSPLPRHAWESLPAADFTSAEVTSRTPLGWGPYVIDQWVAGDHITLHKNPYYFRASEGLPHFNNLVFRFVANGDEALSAVLAGECDLADPSAMSDQQIPQLLKLQEEKSLAAIFETGTAWEFAAFGINSLDAQRPKLFALKEVRQAVAMCLDRQEMVDSLMSGKSTVPNAYLDPAHPLANAQVKQYSYDPAGAAQLLESVGWVDDDGDPTTPRVARSVAGVLDGTRLEFTYLIPEDAERPAAAQMVQTDLAQCGFKVNVETRSTSEFLAPGPNGPVFGRQFDMAQIALPLPPIPSCFLFKSDEIPGPAPDYPQAWGGVNAMGYSSAAYDQACTAAITALAGTPELLAASGEAQAIFAEDLPVLPLYLRFRVFITRPDLCGVEPGTAAGEALWNIETLDYAEGCKP